MYPCGFQNGWSDFDEIIRQSPAKPAVDHVKFDSDLSPLRGTTVHQLLHHSNDSQEDWFK